MLAVQARKKQRKIQQNRTSGSGYAAAGDTNKGICNTWKYKGACPRENQGCPYIHPIDQKGTGKGRKGRGKGKKDGKKQSRHASADSRHSGKSGYRSDSAPKYTPRKDQKGKGKGKSKSRKGSRSGSNSSTGHRSNTPPRRKPKCREYDKGTCKYTKETCKCDHPNPCKQNCERRM